MKDLNTRMMCLRIPFADLQMVKKASKQAGMTQTAFILAACRAYASDDDYQQLRNRMMDALYKKLK
jgi:hypothetical protein